MKVIFDGLRPKQVELIKAIIAKQERRFSYKKFNERN
jgi:hypothetical protein